MAAEPTGSRKYATALHLQTHRIHALRLIADGRTRQIATGLVVILTMLASIPAAGQQGEAGPASIESLAWLSGCWAGTLSSGALYEETWLAPRGGTLLGVARMSRDGRTLSFEFMRIVEDGGTVVYAAQPSGREPTLFRATTGGETEVRFENAEHDFPQRIFYRHSPPDRLDARIEGLRDGQLRGIDFPLRRVACPASPPN